VAEYIDADVTLGADPAGGFSISDIAVTIRVKLDGVDNARFQELATKAETTCPVTKLLAPRHQDLIRSGLGLTQVRECTHGSVVIRWPVAGTRWYTMRVDTTLEFPDLLRLIDERSAVFRAAIAAAPSLDVQVPTCPEWTLLDLVQHLGSGRRRWAAIVAAGPGATPPPRSDFEVDPAALGQREAISAWLAASTQELLDALRESGPDRGCWTWWGASQSPQTSGAVARHQLQEIAMHTYDAQLTVGTTQPVPDDVALDGVDEFLSTCCATTAAWPHTPAVVDYHAAEGRSWRLWLSAEGARVAHLPGRDAVPGTGQDPDAADASGRGTANELVLALYGRIPIRSLTLDGDRNRFDQLVAWEPEV
jgi:uncharacterized protein (TIGR03083 family)